MLIGSVLLFLLIGPFYLFSTWSPLVDYNPVIQGKFKLSIQINKTIGYSHEQGDIKFDARGMNSSYVKINSSIPFQLFAQENPYLQQFDEKMWEECDYTEKTETRDFVPKQVQYCVLRRHSDVSMPISDMARKDLFNNILYKKYHPSLVNVSLQQNY